MKRRKKHLLKTIKEQKKIIQHLQESVVSLAVENIKLKRGK